MLPRQYNGFETSVVSEGQAVEENTKQSLKHQLDEYLEQYYIGERLTPYGGRIPSPEADGFFSEVWTAGSVPNTKDYVNATDGAASSAPQPVAPAMPQGRPTYPVPSDEDEDDPYADIFKIFNRESGSSEPRDESESERRKREEQRERAEQRRREQEAQRRLEEEQKESEQKRPTPERTETRTTSVAVGAYVRSRKEETFSEYLNRVIQERGLKDADVYNSVHMDRKLFNKIRNDPSYQPSKRTALLLSIALHLTLEETQDFIGKAGYLISHSSKTDLIVEFFIVRGIYDVMEINEMLYEFHMPLLLKNE